MANGCKYCTNTDDKLPPPQERQGNLSNKHFQVSGHYKEKKQNRNRRNIKKQQQKARKKSERCQ